MCISIKYYVLKKVFFWIIGSNLNCNLKLRFIIVQYITKEKKNESNYWFWQQSNIIKRYGRKVFHSQMAQN